MHRKCFNSWAESGIGIVRRWTVILLMGVFIINVSSYLPLYNIGFNVGVFSLHIAKLTYTRCFEKGEFQWFDSLWFQQLQKIARVFRLLKFDIFWIKFEKTTSVSWQRKFSFTLSFATAYVYQAHCVFVRTSTQRGRTCTVAVIALSLS